MAKKVLVTGCGGFVGSNLTKRLLKEGYTVTGIENWSYGEKRNINSFKNHPEFTLVEGDITNSELFSDLSAEVVVHLASQKIPRYSTAFRTLEENYRMLQQVVQFAKKQNARIVFASTSDVYGKNPKIPYAETSDLLLGPTLVKRWAYALSKIYGEHTLIANQQEFGLNYTIIRIFGSYGPHQNLTWWGGPQSSFIEKAFKKEGIEIHGDGKQTRTFTYVDDTVDGFFRAISQDKAINEIYNVASEPDEEISIVELADFIWKKVNGPDSTPKLNFIPYETFGNYEDVRRRVPSIEKIKSELGFAPAYNLTTGMEKTIAWQQHVMGL